MKRDGEADNPGPNDRDFIVRGGQGNILLPH
jgi:hypothetical protein